MLKTISGKIQVIPATTAVHDEDLVDAMRYCYNDILTTQRYAYSITNPWKIKKVVFNEPATIILWANGDKTVVKCSEDDVYDPEKGLAMAICKYALGDEFKKVFKEWIPEDEEEETITMTIDEMFEKLKHGIDTMSFAFKIDKKE